MKTDLRPIGEVVKDLGIDPETVENYGKYMAKVPLDNKAFALEPKGKLVLVTAITPTPAGEGKTTTVIGLAQAMRRLGRKVSIAIREPSLGPCFGVKGGATGGGRSKVEPSDRINLSFTGDFPSITAAHNLLSAMINNHIHFGNTLHIDTKRILFPRTIDMNDRSLRSIIVGVGGHENGALAEDSFVITPASEIMAIVGLSTSYSDLKDRLGRIIIGMNSAGEAVHAKDINAHGAMAALLTDAIKPNVVQTTESVPAFIHTGPFGNIAHGTSSIIADRLALRTSEIVITEAGFGSDLGAEKFFDLVSRIGSIPVNAVVIVATVRALKHHGGAVNLSEENTEAMIKGTANLFRHIENIRSFGFDPVVAINRFSGDTKKELDMLSSILREKNVSFSVSDIFSGGGEGGLDLAREVLKHLEQGTPKINYVYDFSDPVREKIEKVARRVYGASGVIYDRKALSDLKTIEKLGLEGLPICIAKTQNSLSDDPKMLNAPENFKVKVEGINISAGAGFLVPLMGSIMTMPGLPRKPSAENIDITDDGEITGLQ